MADDTRQPLTDSSRVQQTPPSPIADQLDEHPENRPFTEAQWHQGGKSGTYKPPENANMMAGGTQNTAGGKVPEVTLSNAFGSIKKDDFLDLPKRPCVRDALMTGIGMGASMGGARAIFRAPVWTACSWAMGTFCVGSTGMYQYCMYRRHAEKAGMMRAVEILNAKDADKRAREKRKEKAREDRRKAKEEEDNAKLDALHKAKDDGGSGGGKSWWKMW